MSTITTKDGTEIFYKAWGPPDGKPIVFSHGWPLTADAWDPQMQYLAQHGFRCVAHDRRGHGRSSQPWQGNDMDTYADDLAELVKHLDLKELTLIGHSTGGGEVTRYVGRHGSQRVAGVVLMGAVPPQMLKTEANPDGSPRHVFDGFRASYLADRSQFFLDVASGPFYGFNRAGAKPSDGVIRSWWLQGMMSGFHNAYECIAAFSEKDFSSDLECFDIPTLVLHGEDDQIVPIEASSLRTSKLIRNAALKVYPGGAHGLGNTNRDEVNRDLLEFVQNGTSSI